MNEKDFQSLIKWAYNCEMNDNHLSDDEREFIVTQFRKMYPTVELPEGRDAAFVEIIY